MELLEIELFDYLTVRSYNTFLQIIYKYICKNRIWH